MGEKDEFYAQLQASVNDVKYKDNGIICGDRNDHVATDRRHREDIIGAFSIGNKNEDGQRIIDFSVRNSLSIMNTFYQHRPSHKRKWYRWNSRDLIYNEKSMIDLFLTNNKMFRDVKAIPSVSMDADQRMVLAKIDVSVPQRKSGIECKRFKIVKLGNPEYVDRLWSRLGEMLPNIVEDQDIEAKWNYFKKKVTEAATDALGEKVPYRGRKKTTPWWIEDVRVAVKHKMNCFRSWMKTRRSDERQSYVAAGNGAYKKG